MKETKKRVTKKPVRKDFTPVINEAYRVLNALGGFGSEDAPEGLVNALAVTHFEINELIDYLYMFNEWRNGSDVEQPVPKEITKKLDKAQKFLINYRTVLKYLRRISENS